MNTALAGLTLRRAAPDDAEHLARLLADATVMPQTLTMPYADAALWRSRLAQPAAAESANLHLLALVDGEVVGSAGLHAEGWSARRRHAVGLGIVVAAAWQGRGVGTALLAALCDYADRWAGVLRIELTVYEDNARAIALYRRFGFVLEGTHRAYALRDGAYVDALAMARLHPQAPALPRLAAVRDAADARAAAQVDESAATSEPWPREGD